MAKLVPMPEGAAERLRLELKKARTKGQYQRVLCVWLRALGVPSRQVARILDWNPVAVRQLQARYLHEGEAAFEGRGRGGRHHQNLTVGDEREFLAGLLNEMRPDATLSARFIQEAYERRLGKPVADTVIYRLLKRHRWRRLAQGEMQPPRWAPYESRVGTKPAQDGV